MKRLHLFEFEDQKWFPAIVRGYMTDYLNFTANLSSKPFKNLSKKLASVLRSLNESQLIDLCSGGAGPIPQVAKLLRNQESYPVTVLLTDLYPNRTAFEKAAGSDSQIHFVSQSVDATEVPAEMKGFRTLFNSFHHFRPTSARKILEDAATSKQGIMVVELVGRSPFGFLSVFIGFIMLLFFTPFIRPFRISRLVFTYILPVVPIFVLWDGIVSCFRVYSPEELKELTSSIRVKDYHWEVGTLSIEHAPGNLTYLMGYPLGKP